MAYAGAADHAPDDTALARLARDGDGQAFGALVARHQQSVFNVCYRLTGERREAEDMAQEAFIRAYQRLRTFDPARPFGPWMRRVAANVCLNQLQTKRPAVFSLDDETDTRAASLQADEAGDPGIAHERRANANAIQSALLALPAHYRAVVELCHFQEMSYAEASATLRLPVSDVKSHLYRARQTLAKRLGQHP